MVDKRVEIRPLTYHNELMNSFAECRRLRNAGSPRYTRAVWTLYDHTLTSDRHSVAEEHIWRLVEEDGLKEDYQEIRRIERMKMNPDKKERVANERKKNLSWVMADIIYKACRIAMEEFDDFEYERKPEMPEYKMRKRRAGVESGRNPR